MKGSTDDGESEEREGWRERARKGGMKRGKERGREKVCMDVESKNEEMKRGEIGRDRKRERGLEKQRKEPRE